MRSKILVVDDNTELLGLVCLSLLKSGFTIGTATNGLEALKKAKSVSPDLIIMDVVMPDLDGFAVCETLRENPATAAVPILILSGLQSHISRQTALESGASGYLTKPFDPEQLIAKVEELLCQASVASKAPAKTGPRPVMAPSR